MPQDFPHRRITSDRPAEGKRQRKKFSLQERWNRRTDSSSPKPKHTQQKKSSLHALKSLFRVNGLTSAEVDAVNKPRPADPLVDAAVNDRAVVQPPAFVKPSLLPVSSSRTNSLLPLKDTRSPSTISAGIRPQDGSPSHSARGSVFSNRYQRSSLDSTVNSAHPSRRSMSGSSMGSSDGSPRHRVDNGNPVVGVETETGATARAKALASAAKGLEAPSTKSPELDDASKANPEEDDSTMAASAEWLADSVLMQTRPPLELLTEPPSHQRTPPSQPKTPPPYPEDEAPPYPHRAESALGSYPSWPASPSSKPPPPSTRRASFEIATNRSWRQASIPSPPDSPLLTDFEDDDDNEIERSVTLTDGEWHCRERTMDEIRDKAHRLRERRDARKKTKQERSSVHKRSEVPHDGPRPSVLTALRNRSQIVRMRIRGTKFLAHTEGKRTLGAFKGRKSDASATPSRRRTLRHKLSRGFGGHVPVDDNLNLLESKVTGHIAADPDDRYIGFGTPRVHLTLADVMDLPQYCSVLRDFLTANFCVENLEFLEAVKAFERIENAEERRLAGQAIYHKFVKVDAYKAVNIGSKAHAACLRQVEQDVFPRNTFAVSASVCFRLMDRDIFRRFLKSPEYNLIVCDPEEAHARYKQSRGQRHSFSLLRVMENYATLDKIAEAILNEVNFCKTHRVGFSTYRNSFTGSDLVDWIIYSEHASLRPAAFTLAQRLNEAQLVQHVYDKDVEFADRDTTYYIVRLPKDRRRHWPKIEDLLKGRHVAGEMLLKGVHYNRVWVLLSTTQNKLFMYRPGPKQVPHSSINLRGVSATMHMAVEGEEDLPTAPVSEHVEEEEEEPMNPEPKEESVLALEARSSCYLQLQRGLKTWIFLVEAAEDREKWLKAFKNVLVKKWPILRRTTGACLGLS